MKTTDPMPPADRAAHDAPDAPDAGLFGPTDSIPAEVVSQALHAADRLEQIAAVLRHEIAAVEAGGPAWKFELALAYASDHADRMGGVLAKANRAAGAKPRRKRR